MSYRRVVDFFFSPTWQFFCPICRIHCEHFFLCFSADVTLGEEARWHWLIGKCCCFKKGLSSLLHPSTQGSSWQAGWCWDWGGTAVSGLGVHECKSLCVCVCVCVCWMQMRSRSCVVQSGCTRRATAEHSAEIIHQSKHGSGWTARCMGTEQIHTSTYMHVCIYSVHDQSQSCRNTSLHVPFYRPVPAHTNTGSGLAFYSL